ncbi:hypothetical protein N665_0025s0112 [Sinapis alba]|nr:hypothetical protein N665_0025s0112 [Sinapis alba]
METMEIPIFYGEEPEEWVTWMDAFIADQSLSEFETRQFTYGFIDGEAHTWYCEELSRSGFDSWEDLKVRLVRRFSTRVVEAKEQPSLMEHIKQMRSLLDRLQQRWKEEDESKKLPEEETMVIEDTEEIVSCVEGKRSSNDLILEPIPSLTKPEVKNEACVFMSEPVTQVATSEKALKEDQLVPMGNPVLGKQSGREQSGNTTKKKKRWKTALEAQQCSRQNLRLGRRRRTVCRHEEVTILPNTHQLFGKMFRRATNKKKNKKQKFTRAKGFKYRSNMVGASSLQFQRKSKSRRQEGKQDTPKQNTKRKFSGNSIACLWNSKYQLSLSRKTFRWYKKRHDKILHLRSNMRLQLYDMGKLSWEFLLVAEQGKRDKTKSKHKGYRKFFSLVTSLWTKQMKVNRQRVIHKYSNMHKINYKRRVAKVKGFKYKHRAVNSRKCHGENLPNENVYRRFSGKQIALSWNSKTALELVRRNIEGGHKSSKRKRVKIVFLENDKQLQLDGNGEFFEELLLAAVKRKMINLKYMLKSCGKFILLDITVGPPKDQGKRNKRRVKNDKLRRWKYKLGRMELSLQWFLVSEKSTEQEMMSWTEGGKTEGRIKLDVLLMELDSTKGILKLHRLETLKNTEVNWRQQMENIDIQRCGLLGSVFLEKENDEIKCLKPVKKSTRGPVKSLRVKHSFEWGNRVWEPGIETGRRVGSDDGNKVKWKFKGEFTAPNPIHVNDEEDSITEYSVFIAKTNARQLKFDHVLEWGLGKYVPAVETSTQWRRTGIGVDMSSEQPVEFTWQDYIDVAAFTRDTVEDAIKRNQQRELNENLFALDIAYVLFGAPRPPEQSFTGRGLRNKGWDVHESDEEKQAVEVCDRERKLFSELGGISSTKLLCVHISVLCWEKKDKHEESSVLNERNDANQSMCLNLEDKVDFKGGSIVTCVILMNKAQRR